MNDVPKEIVSRLHQAFIDNVKARRKELGLTQDQVAVRLGISRPAYTEIELGRSLPGLQLIERVADALEIDASQLLNDAHVTHVAG